MSNPMSDVTKTTYIADSIAANGPAVQLEYADGSNLIVGEGGYAYREADKVD